MKRLTIAICILLFFGLTSSATTPTTSNASLKGTYIFLIHNTKVDTWGQSLNCGGNFVFMGGSRASSEVDIGTATLDGAGGLTGTFTDYGNFDSASSNATVSCSSGGNAVYFAPQTGTVTGTYSVQSNGTGTITMSVSNGDTFSAQILLVGNCASTGVNDAFLLTGLNPNHPNAVDGSGSARLQ